MPKVSLSQRFLGRSIAAAIAAIEIYNKPDFEYRDESFALLMVNAWELLLKAKLLAERNNKVTALYVYETRSGKGKSPTKRQYRKLNRAGNPMTMSLFAVVDTLNGTSATKVPSEVEKNLRGLVEVRDNATHFITVSPQTSLMVLELGMAAVRNYMLVTKKWFGYSFADYKFYLMPMTLVTDHTVPVRAINLSSEARRVIDFVNDLKAGRGEVASDFHITTNVHVQLLRQSGTGVTEVRLSNDPNAIPMKLVEDDVYKSLWTTGELIARMRKKYSDFVQNKTFYEHRDRIVSGGKFVKVRQLDPSNPRSGQKTFYNPNILQEFDAVYTQR
jgi:hypothetical protein